MLIRKIGICSAGLALLLPGVGSTGFAQGPAITLTEAQAVEHALGQQAVQSLYAGALNAARGDVIQAGTFPNPTVGLERQPLSGSLAEERQSTYTVSQRFDIGGKRGLRLDAAHARLAETQAEVEARRNGLRNEVRRRFHDALSAQIGVAALVDWERRLQAVEAIADKLQKGGEVAGYDRRRVGRERATASSRAKVASAELARLLSALRALIGMESERSVVLAGPLLPEPLAPLESYLTPLESRPDLKALAARTQALRYEETLAQRTRIPDVTLSAGVRQVERGSLSDSGLILGLSIPLPIFERGQGAGQRAAGQAQAAAAERQIALARAQGNVRGLWQQAVQLRGAAEEFRRDAVDASRRLADIAQSAYRGGELGILELLDAHRSLVDAETRALELELSARVAQLDLDFATAGSER